MTEIDLLSMLKLYKINKKRLTFSFGYDTLVMLGRLSAAPFRMPEIVV